MFTSKFWIKLFMGLDRWSLEELAMSIFVSLDNYFSPPRRSADVIIYLNREPGRDTIHPVLRDEPF